MLEQRSCLYQYVFFMLVHWRILYVAIPQWVNGLMELMDLSIHVLLSIFLYHKQQVSFMAWWILFNCDTFPILS